MGRKQLEGEEKERLEKEREELKQLIKERLNAGKKALYVEYQRLREIETLLSAKKTRQLKLTEVLS